MTYTVCHVPLELLVRGCYRSATIATVKLQTVVINTVAECCPFYDFQVAYHYNLRGARHTLYAMFPSNY